VTGSQGPQGERGPRGEKGEEGEEGKQGPVGPKGDTGATGEDGKTGPQGPQGERGPRGETGEEGEEGKPGPVGPKGDTGATGPNGDSGATGSQGATGPKGDSGPQGATGPKGDSGDTGSQGATGPKGDSGATGSQGATGPKGDTGPQGVPGPIGPQGIPGICDCSCVEYINTFITNDLSGGAQGTKLVYNIPNKINFVVYGFDIAGLPSNLYIRTGQTPTYENGIGFVNSIDNEIDTLHFAQIDLGDFIRKKTLKCSDPTMKIGSIQIGEGFSIYGSNTLGQLGTLLYSYTNTINNTDSKASQEFIIPSYNTTNLTSSGDIYKYGSIPFRYISVTAIVGNVTLNLLSLYLCC
jgi:hypothetical protein